MTAHKEMPAVVRYARVLDMMERGFADGTQLSRHSYDDVMVVQKQVIYELEAYYGTRAVKNTFNKICRDKGWATRATNKAAKEPKDGVDARLDHVEQSATINALSIIKLAGRVKDIAGVLDKHMGASIELKERQDAINVAMNKRLTELENRQGVDIAAVPLGPCLIEADTGGTTKTEVLADGQK